MTSLNEKRSLDLDRLSFSNAAAAAAIDEKGQLPEEEDSPFEMVRAAVSNKDDPTLPVMTFRFWFLGILFTILLSFVNQFFYYRTRPMSIGLLVVQLLAYPLGHFMARVLPRGPLNPGPFNIKEHVLITIMANAGAGTAYAVDIVTIKRIFYKSDLGFLGSFLLILTTQCIGYGLAGICRRFLVRPAAMIWPSNLVSVTMFRTLHEEDERAGKGITRLKFFGLVSLCSFIWYLFPGFLATFLSSISILCYFAPKNQLIQQIGSGSKGMGLFSFSLDWNTITGYLGSPLVTPFWAEINAIIGFILVCWVLLPIGYYVNFWDAQTFPMLSSEVMKTNGEPYNALAIMNPQTHGFDEALYSKYGPLRISYLFAISYGVGFATLSAVLVHTLLYHGEEIVTRFREARRSDDDIHAKLMDRYPEVPDMFYACFFFVNLALSIFVCSYYDIQLPWWGVLLAVAIAAVFVLPIGIITAIANTTPGLNIITEFVIGYILPGYPIANVTFKTYGYICMVQAVSLIQDLKLGHYMKIPPRAVFIAQAFGTILAGLINLSTAYLLFNVIPDICTKGHPYWGCTYTHVFYSASVLWGVIGPARMFGPGSHYSLLMWWFLIGALAPIPFWLLARKYPNSIWKYVHVPVILGATAVMPPAKPVMYTSWFVVGFIFQWFLFRYRHSWWARFNYVFTAAMDSGVTICVLFLFVVLQFWKVNVDWWGNQEECPLVLSP